MNKSFGTTLVLLLCVITFLSACAPAPQPTAAVPAVQPTVEATVPEPTAQPTSLPPTATIPAPTDTPEPSPTDVQAATVKAIGNLNCRMYPSNSTNVIGYLKKNQQTEVLGKDASGEWYLIANLTYPDRENCWIFNSELELSVDPSEIPVVSAARPY